MKELTNQEKIELVEETVRRIKKELKDDYFSPQGLCLWITLVAFGKNFLTHREFLNNSSSSISLQLIPELLKIKPEDKKISEYWFGETCIKNVLARLKALERLLEILKSDKDERTVNT